MPYDGIKLRNPLQDFSIFYGREMSPDCEVRRDSVFPEVGHETSKFKEHPLKNQREANNSGILLSYELKDSFVASVLTGCDDGTDSLG
jgi:hypothetical protein